MDSVSYSTLLKSITNHEIKASYTTNACSNSNQTIGLKMNKLQVENLRDSNVKKYFPAQLRRPNPNAGASPHFSVPDLRLPSPSASPLECQRWSKLAAGAGTGPIPSIPVVFKLYDSGVFATTSPFQSIFISC